MMTARNLVCVTFFNSLLFNVYMDIVRHTITETINSRAYGHVFLKMNIARLFKVYV